MFVKPYLFGALTLLSASSALALTCANDYGSSAGCASNTTAAGDCATLGFSQDNVDGCEHYLYCPFDTSYKRCVASEKIDCSDYPFEECLFGLQSTGFVLSQLFGRRACKDFCKRAKPFHEVCLQLGRSGSD